MAGHDLSAVLCGQIGVPLVGFLRDFAMGHTRSMFPVVGGILQEIPHPVLGGATTIILGSVITVGLKIIDSIEIGRRETIILATFLGLRLGVAIGLTIYSSTIIYNPILTG